MMLKLITLTKGKMMNKTLHMIGNSHIDLAWFWTKSEGLQEVKNTFRSALDRMKEFSDFKFTTSSVYFHKWIELIDKDMFHEIKVRVNEGRWNIVGGFLIEPDCNLPSGECLIRQGLYGQKYLKDKFGFTCKIGYNIDSFGHNSNLPQILKQVGIEYYIFMRPISIEMKLDSPFINWEGIDGTEVKTCRVPCEYTAWSKETLKINVEDSLSVMDENSHDMLCFYGVGNHGGGPTIENIKNVYEFMKEYEDVEFKFSSIDEFFKHIKDENFKNFKGEIKYHAVGCYSVVSSLKRLNRICENRLLEAEKLSTIAYMLNNEVNLKNKIDKAYEMVLLNHFHDTIAGTSIKEACDDAINMYNFCLVICEEVVDISMQKIAQNIDTKLEKGIPLILFNTKSYENDEWIELEIPYDCRWPLRILDEDLNEVYYERVMTEVITINKNFNGRRKVIFKKNLKAMSYSVLSLVKEEPSFMVNPSYERQIIQEDYIENDKIRLEFTRDKGLNKIIDKTTGNNILKSNLEFKIIEDLENPWAGGRFSFNKVIATFKVVDIKKMEHGEIRKSMAVNYEHGKSTLTLIFNIYGNDENIVIKNYLNNDEKQSVIKLSIPLNIYNPCIINEVPYGFERRDIIHGQEEFTHSYISVMDENRYGMIISSDSKYAYDFKEDTLNLTILRSPIYAQGNHLKEINNTHFKFIDKGYQEFTVLLGLNNDIDGAKCKKASDLINGKVYALFDTCHEGHLKDKSYSFIENSNDNINISVVKISEDEEGIILRAYECSGFYNKTLLNIALFNIHVELSFKPFEIKTLNITRDGNGIIEVNAIENLDK